MWTSLVVVSLASSAQPRLATDPAVDSLVLADGHDLLTAAFCVVPFVYAPFPEPSFGDAVTPAARAAFRATSASSRKARERSWAASPGRSTAAAL